MHTHWTVLIFHVVLGHTSVLATAGGTGPGEICNDSSLQLCARNADSLLKNSSLVFPDSQNAVDKVCSVWNELTGCINAFTKRCLTREQRTQFDRGFQQPVSSMITLCQDKEYRKDYLRSAPCVKKVLTEGNYCGNQYRFLIDHVSGSSSTTKQICCARAKFKNCILQKTPEKCDSDKKGSGLQTQGRRFGEQSTNATSFALTTVDKSLAMWAHQCSTASFREADCPGINATYRQNNKGPLRPNPELEAAASGEQSTQFDLPHPNPPQTPSKQSVTTTGNPTTKPSTTHKLTSTTTKRVEEKPKTDKLSSENSGVKREPMHDKSSATSLRQHFPISLLWSSFSILFNLVSTYYVIACTF